MNVAQLNQKANCQPATRDKAKRLVVETINETSAYVVGDTDTHMVTFRDLSCDCQAWGRGLRCSHVLAAVRERALLRGFTHCAFLRDAQKADAYGAMQRGLGRKAISHTAGRYHWCEFSSTTRDLVPRDEDVLRPSATELDEIQRANPELYAAGVAVARAYAPKPRPAADRDPNWPARSFADVQRDADSLY